MILKLKSFWKSAFYKLKKTPKKIKKPSITRAIEGFSMI